MWLMHVADGLRQMYVQLCRHIAVVLSPSRDQMAPRGSDVGHHVVSPAQGVLTHVVDVVGKAESDVRKINSIENLNKWTHNSWRRLAT